jgi:hypothetical protein
MAVPASRIAAVAAVQFEANEDLKSASKNRSGSRGKVIVLEPARI